MNSQTTSSSNQKPQDPQAQMAALNMMVPASYYNSSYGYQLQQRQHSSYPSVQEQYIPGVTRFIQPIKPFAIIPCDIANGYTYHVDLAHPYGTLLHQEQPILPYQNIAWQFVPAARSESSNSVPASRTSQIFHPVPLARPGQQEIYVAPPRYPESMSRHTNTHTGKKPYECGKSFALSDLLKQHMKIHSRKKPEGSLRFKCQEPGCGKAFKMGSQLRAHTRWHMGHKGHVCSRPGCKLWFLTNCALQKHMRTHTREKPYRCEICDMEFTTSRSLGRHTSLHSTQVVALRPAETPFKKSTSLCE